MMSVPSVPKPKLYGIALWSIKLRRRISMASMPVLAAMASIRRSRTKVVS